jgi:RHS repeat-associated protein
LSWSKWLEIRRYIREIAASAPLKRAVFSVFVGVVAMLFPVAGASAAADGNPRWRDYYSNTTNHSSAAAACYRQWLHAKANANVGNLSRFIGAKDRDSGWISKDCEWTLFQYLCPQETQGQSGSCGTSWGATVSFQCDSQYTRNAPFECIPASSPQPPERPPNTCPTDADPRPNYVVGNPVILSTGAKFHTDVDFETGDELFTIGRTYRNFAGRSTTSYRERTLGLGYGWRFDHALELQLGEFTGSPSSPTGHVTVFAPDGSTYDFTLNSSGAFVPRAASGMVSQDYKVEFIGTLPSSLATIYNSQTQWRVTGPDDRVWTLYTFPQVNKQSVHNVARPTEIKRRDGYTWTLSYGSDSRLTSIVDTFGRTATFTWNMFYVTSLTGIAGSLPVPEAVDTITFPDGTTAKYLYDPPPATSGPSTTTIMNLVGVELRDASSALLKKTTYHYEDPDLKFALTGITDSRNVRISTYEYDRKGRVTRTVGANGQNEYTIAYSTSGSLLVLRTVTNPLGKQTVYKFTKANSSSTHNIRLTSVEGAASANCPASIGSYTYDANYYVATRTDEEGRVTSYTRDARGRPTQIIEAFGTAAARTTNITWHATYNEPILIETPDLDTSIVWDANGRMESVTQTDATGHTAPYSTNGQTRTWTYTYTAEGRVASVDGPLAGTGDTVSYTYDADGYVATYTDELGHVTTVNAVNDRGQPTEVEDANGLITELVYDDLGRLTSQVADPGGIAATTAYEYDEVGNVTKVTQPNGAFLEYTYDDSKRVTRIESNYGDNIEYVHDDMGNVTQISHSNGFPQLFFQWNQTFDELGRMISITGVATETWTQAYDKVGNLKSRTDPNSETVAYAYDGLNRLLSTTDERGDVTAWAYGAQAEPASTTDDRSVVTGYVRNGWGETIQETSPDIGTTVYERDANGAVVERTDGRGVVTEFAYDDGGRIGTKVFPGETASNVSYSYDSVAGGNAGVGRLTGVTDAAGTVAYTYDLLGRVTAETRVIGAASYTTGYAYDDAGNVSTITYPSGRTIYYDRDDVGDISVVRQQPSGGSTSWLALWIGRAPFGPRIGLQFANGTREWRHHDSASRMSALEVLKESPATLYADRTYAYSDKRNLTAITDLLNSANSQTFTYADNGFLASAIGPYGTLAFTHDGVGNRTQRTTNTGGGPIPEDFNIASGSNRLQSMSTGGVTSRSFSYDAAGNLTQDQDIFYSQTQVLAWNHPGQIASVTRNSIPRGAYTYDYLHRLVARDIQSGVGMVHRVHDLDGNVIAEYHASGYLMTEYVWLEDRPIAVIADAGGTPRTLWVHTDHLERPFLMTNAAGNVVWEASYRPFGEVASITGAETLDYRFPGQWFQMESGLHYNCHRHYDATTGRYVSPDPIGMPDGPSRYAYVLNSPLMGVDREGLRWLSGPGGGRWWCADFTGLNCVWFPPPPPNYCEMPDVMPISPPISNAPDPQCRKASKWDLLQAWIDDEHEYKISHRARPPSRFDICKCRDGSIRIAEVGECGSTRNFWD